MTVDRLFRFGVQVTRAYAAEQWSAFVRRCEHLGFAVVLLPDHFVTEFAPLPALAAAAAGTRRLRLGTLVMNNDMRHPAILAKDAATVDLLSNGRLELGIGAGWMVDDYRQAGIEFERGSRRIDRLAESLEVIRQCFSRPTVTFHGVHYQVERLPAHPEPVQARVPFLIGAGGPRMLALAAQHADIVSINPTFSSGSPSGALADDATTAAFDDKVARLRSSALSRMDQIEVASLAFHVDVEDAPPRHRREPSVMAAHFAGRSDLGPSALVGTTATLIDSLQSFRDRWLMSYFIVPDWSIDMMAPIVDKLTGS